MRRLLAIYRQSFINNVNVDLSFRLNFFLIIVLEIIWLGVLAGQFHFLLGDGNRLGPWEGDTYFFFVALVTLVDNLFLSLVAQNFWNLSELLRTGSLDFLMTKPGHSLFLVMSQKQRLSGLISACISLAVVLWLAPRLEVDWGLAHVAATVFIVFICMALRMALETAIACFNFVTIEGNAINFFRINIQQFAKYPAFVYRDPARMVLTRIFPLCLVTTLPVDWALGRAGPLWSAAGVAVGLTVVFWWVALKAWAWGLNSYESASS